MYSTCIFCHGGLGANESIEHFPVGARLAYDGEKGRLWVVCPVCARWNLSPLEERWEALEECERAFRATSVRTSTENIGLARLRDGTMLVRIGRPMRPEFAAWRYGMQFAEREKRAVLTGLSISGVVLGLGLASVFAAPLAALAGAPIVALAEWKKRGLARGAGYRATERALRLLRDDAGEMMLAVPRVLDRVRLRTAAEASAEGGWGLRIRTGLMPRNETLRTYQMPESAFPLATGFVPVDPREHTLTGAAGLRALAVMMAHANAAGGTERTIQTAVRLIDRARSPEAFLAVAEAEARRQGLGYREIWQMPVDIRLALEMAAHEDAERRALQGELAELERQWREAEEVAAIADALPLAPAMESRLATLRAAKAEGAPLRRR